MINFCVFYRIWDQIKRRSSYQTLPTVESKPSYVGGKIGSSIGIGGVIGGSVYSKRDGIRKPELYKELNHPIFKSIKVVHNPMVHGR